MVCIEGLSSSQKVVLLFIVACTVHCAFVMIGGFFAHCHCTKILNLYVDYDCTHVDDI